RKRPARRQTRSPGAIRPVGSPSWDLEKWKDLRGHLNQQPGDDRVRDRDFVNVSPPQFPEEFLQIHRGTYLAASFGGSRDNSSLGAQRVLQISDRQSPS